MAPRKYSDDFKLKLVRELKAGNSKYAVAHTYGLDRSLLSRWVSKYDREGVVKTLHLGGRPRSTTDREDGLIRMKLKSNPFLSSNEIVTSLGLNVNPSTVRRRAINMALRAYRPAKKPFLSKKNIVKRLKFALDHKDWTASRWRNVLWSDECKFNLFSSDGIQYVRRAVGERLAPRHCVATVKHGGGHVMVWGCFSANGVGPLHEVLGIMDRFQYRDILETIMLPYAEDVMPLHWVFQQDNDPKHTSRLVKDWIQEKGLHVMDWPPQSPDLSPIENLWSIIKQKLSGKRFQSKKLLFEAIKTEWEKVPIDMIIKLVDSMPQRCAEVIKNKGHHTHY